MTTFYNTPSKPWEIIRAAYRDVMYVNAAQATTDLLNMGADARVALNNGQFDAVPNRQKLATFVGFMVAAGQHGRYYRFAEVNSSALEQIRESEAFVGSISLGRGRHAVVAKEMSAVGNYVGLDRSQYARFYAVVDGVWEPYAEGAPENLVVQELSGWGQGFSLVSPAPELLEGLPAMVREAAVAAVPTASGDNMSVLVQTGDGFDFAKRPMAMNNITAEGLISQARAMWRETIRTRMSQPSDADREFERKREEHRTKTRQNFEAFARRDISTEDHIPTLPFVPHGLASSRRWGIEVESGGARGVNTPDGWRGISDGSLRSAYEGYREVQDFEPYDEPYEELVYAVNCERDHNPRIEVYDAMRGESLWLPNEGFIDPRECDSCGRQQRVRRVEPQTIIHRAEGGDCREFVSPILVSMHSKGLEYLCEELSKRPQNDTSGVHVHVEASDLTSEQIATLVYGYDLLEPLLEASYHRNNRQYCNRRDVGAVLEAARSIRGGSGIDTDAGSRYMTLNTHSLSEHGTIEFRAMGPVYKYETLTRWAMFCRELVNAVANGATNKDFAQITTWEGVLQLLAKFGQEYVRASVFEMTGETGEVAKLLKEDRNPTVEALNADLTAAWDNLTQILRRATIPVERLAERLVGVGSSEL